MIKQSAGIMFVYKKKALLFHATRAKDRTYMPPKGGIEKDETDEDAASRETLEESGILYPSKKLDTYFIVEYTDNKGKLYKIAKIFVVEIKSLEEIGLTSEIVPYSQLQVEEVDEGHFMDAEEIKARALPRYVDYILDHL